MTYNEALEIIGACLGGSTNRKDFKEALRGAQSMEQLQEGWENEKDAKSV